MATLDILSLSIIVCTIYLYLSVKKYFIIITHKACILTSFNIQSSLTSVIHMETISLEGSGKGTFVAVLEVPASCTTCTADVTLKSQFSLVNL